MPAATLTSKGQITIPASVRAELGLDTGSRVEFVRIAEGQYAMVPATLAVQSLKGMFRKRATVPTVEQMNRAIAKRGALAR
jgi:AbrB family looped-hinge helix DNA binding protein